MKKMYVKSIIAAGMALVFALGTTAVSADDKHHREKQKEKHEEESGIRKGSLYEEETVMPGHGEYSTSEPGKSKRIARAFENSPPLIPHDLTGMLPIAETNNACLGCHMPEPAKGLAATPMPKSHFFDIDTGRDLGGRLDNKRYPCMQCHVPQVNIPEPIKNQFKADFRSKKSRTRSDLLETLNEGLKSE